MKHTKLAISIPTCDRAKHVKEYLELIADATLNSDLSIHIYDGSGGKSTSGVVENYINRGYSNIYYYHRPEQKIGPTRIYDAFMEPDADYIWLCGDKFLIKPENYDLIFTCINQNYDVIAMYDKGNGVKIFTRPEEMMRECMWFMTHFGSVIIKKNLIKNYTYDWYIQGISASFHHIRLYAEALSKTSFRGIRLHINNKTLKKISKYNTASGTENQIWSVWIKEWNDAINELPVRYNKYKREIILSAGINMETLTLRGFLKFGNQANLKSFWEYREYLTHSTKVPLVVVFIIACLPNEIKKILWQLIYK